MDNTDKTENQKITSTTVILWDKINKKFAVQYCCCEDCTNDYVLRDKPEHYEVLDIIEHANLPTRLK